MSVKSILELYTPLPEYQIDKLYVCIATTIVFIQILNNPEEKDKILNIHNNKVNTSYIVDLIFDC